jgi:hypothetical protein
VIRAPTSFTPRTEPLRHGGGPTQFHQAVERKVRERQSSEGGEPVVEEEALATAQIGRRP